MNHLDFLDRLDNEQGSSAQELSKTRATVLAALVALGLGASLSQVIPTQTNADKAGKSARIAQDGGGY